MGVTRTWRVGVVWVLMLMVSECSAHVRLTFPPARKYQLDFLDNVRTPGPCGMPPGLSGERTSLQAGSPLDVRWHLSYPHQGGYFFQLLDKDNRVQYRYPIQQDALLGTEDGTSMHAVVPLPSDSCEQCTLRMVRQAREWGGNYLFWSCADVTITQAVDESDQCSGHGTVRAGVCTCQPLYFGPRCQFKEECVANSDCGPRGVCVDIQATSFPTRQCYCQQGWFGPRCQYESSVKSKPTDFSGYANRTLSSDADVTVYYRTVQDEVEVVVRARTTSWLGLGWRPTDISRSCQNFPDLGSDDADGESTGEPGSATSEGTPETTAEGTPETTAEGTPETTAEGTPESTAEGTPEITAEGTPESTSEPESTAEGTPESTAEGTPETTAEGTPETTAEGTPETTAEGTPETTSEGTPESTAEGTPETTAEGTPESTAEGTPETTSEPESTAEGTPETTSEPESTAEGTPETTAEGTPETTAEGTPETTSEPETTAEGTPETTSEPETTAEGTPETTAEGTPETTAEGTPETTAEGTPETTAEGTPETTAEGTPETTAEGTPESTAEGTPETTAEGTPETTAEGTPEGTPEGTAEGEPSSSSGLHPMDCTDIVIGSARGSYSRIGDYYTRDRSTPVRDEEVGGEDSLTAGLVWEEGQHTLMLFRRKLTAVDAADHSLEDAVTHVIWAVGQEKDQGGHYSHWPASALESSRATITDFYRQDELKYHGHRGQRGTASLNFHTVLAPEKDVSKCGQGSCPSSHCGLDFSWTYDNDTDIITFNISSTPISPNHWIALGFSNDTYMRDSDVIYGGIREGNPFVTDGWLFGRTSPRVDSQSDVTLVSGQYADSTLTLVFSRPRKTTDDLDDLDLSECHYVFFADQGGLISDTGIGQHTSTPIVSSQKVCFGGCPTEGDVTSTVSLSSRADQSSDMTTRTTLAPATTTKTPDTVIFTTLVSIRLAQGQYHKELGDSGSLHFQRLANIVESNMYFLLLGSLGDRLVDIAVVRFRPGSIIVDAEMETVHEAGVSAQQVHQEMEAAVRTALTDRVIEGFGNLQVLSVSSPVTDEDEPTDDSDLTEVEIIIICIVIALLCVALLIGVCKCCESRRPPPAQDRQRVCREEDNSTPSGSTGSNPKASTMSYSEFLDLKAVSEVQQPSSPFHPAFDNPGYEHCTFKSVP